MTHLFAIIEYKNLHLKPISLNILSMVNFKRDPHLY